MTDYTDSKRKSRGRARERQLQRKRRREAMVTISKQTPIVSRVKLPGISLPGLSGMRAGVSVDKAKRAGGVMQDIIWRLIHRTSFIKIGVALVVLAVLAFIGVNLLSPQIAPNIWSLDMRLSGKTVEEAQSMLATMWRDEVKIDLILDGQLFLSIAPQDIGLRLDAGTMAETAKSVGLSGVPFGVDIKPVVDMEYIAAQNYLLTLVDRVYTPPFEAGYEWRDGNIVGIPGKSSRELDIARTLDMLQQGLDTVVVSRRLELMTRATPPNMLDPAPYIDDAYALVSQGFQLIGYDPFKDTRRNWDIRSEELTEWLAAGPNGLTLRTERFEDFLNRVNDQLRSGDVPQYIDERDAIDKMNTALLRGDINTVVRVRHLPTEYTVISGDSGYRIGRKTGVPYGMIERINPNTTWEALSVGDTVMIPSKDELLQVDPVPHKRIIVDLQRQWLVAYENGEIVFDWPISSGRSSAPTYPGIFQILSKQEVAYGSGFSLCGAGNLDCGRWEMSWFMGIYEVIPGLMNGFHGAVLLPDGTYLGGGGVRYPSTFGCVMSEDANAELLFQWADQGVMVEILSSEFAPQSELGRLALEHIRLNSY